MHKFDHIITSLFDGGYGRYVDDFYIISTDKSLLLQMINPIKEYLLTKKIKLHPQKINLQHYTKGLLFVGGYVKPNRMYTSNRTVSNFVNLVRELNKRKPPVYIERLVCRLNSYLGFLIHTSSYTIRRRILSLLDQEWYTKIYIKGDFQIVGSYDDYKLRRMVVNLIKHNTIW